MFEQAFRNIDDVLRKEAGCTTELDYTEQTSWLLFLKYLDGLEEDKATEAALNGKKYTYILDKPYRWESWAAPKGKPEKTKLDSTFLKYLLLSSLIQQRIRVKGTGATVQGIKASLLKLIEISFPKSLSKQKQIIEELDSLSEETQHLASLYERKLAALEELKKSLLHQAFTGAL